MNEGTMNVVITKGYEDGKVVAWEAGATFSAEEINNLPPVRTYHVALPGNEPDGVIFAIDDAHACEFAREKLISSAYEDCEIFERVLTWRGVKGHKGQH